MNFRLILAGWILARYFVVSAVLARIFAYVVDTGSDYSNNLGFGLWLGGAIRPHTALYCRRNHRLCPGCAASRYRFFQARRADLLADLRVVYSHSTCRGWVSSHACFHSSIVLTWSPNHLRPCYVILETNKPKLTE